MYAFANNRLINFTKTDKTAVKKFIHDPPSGYRSLGCLAIFAIIRYDSAKLEQVTCYIQSHNTMYKCAVCTHNLWSCSMMSCAFQGDKWMVCYLPDPFSLSLSVGGLAYLQHTSQISYLTPLPNNIKQELCRAHTLRVLTYPSAQWYGCMYLLSALKITG